ncbi:site-specific DNA-methyltransferase [uncultured Bacteroides sp.]|uniref:DNA-methyltransferase n=1 Tax=uncultured Bacteroides sp. TaxID=162156 RepID=UPI0025E6072B|nr:site-specific DNA-methyltransferase [uncultured Bacteroides sp.]
MRKNKKDNYRISTVKYAKSVALVYIKEYELDKVTKFGLPEIDDRFDIWRVPVLSMDGAKIGEIVIDAISSFVDINKTTTKEILENRLLGRKPLSSSKKNCKRTPKISMLSNTIRMGDSEELLMDMPNECVDLVFTSPPYYNAKPEYAEYLSYEEYLLKMRKIIHQCARVLNEGRFFVLNVSPVLIRRTSRNEASKRIAVPFDFHRIFIEEGFEFIDDIHWVKPEGAGWATGRGRRFAADRNPLQYKPVPITEYILVYRKKTDKLIDWLIREHPDQQALQESKIEDGYDVTNIWKITPVHNKHHPAVFPVELAEKVIKYYSIKNDVVLDPFAGTGTTGKAAIKLNRRFALLEQDEKYVNLMKTDFVHLTNLINIDWVNIDLNNNVTLF